MPPSYGKTETIARSFIAWALGRDKKRKFIYISYSDELCRKISNQVRDLLKSPFYKNVFGEMKFLQDNSSEFVLREGGGLFVTTLKSAITGFHADSILIDDPIKVSAMNSKIERDAVNQNFKESVLSRLQNNESNITILMQRLGFEDLCGFLLDERHFSKELIAQWKIIKLEALNTDECEYKVLDFSYTRAREEPLFKARHDKQELLKLKLQMGIDEFSTQYQQEPQASESGFFEPCNFKEIPSYDIGENNEYIFIDNAMSLNSRADNRALVVIGVENYKESIRYVVKNCFYGIWDEEKTCEHIIQTLISYPNATCYIENEGGGIILHRLLLKELVRVNELLKKQNKALITNTIKAYSALRNISKVEKIKALKPYYNSGNLVFFSNAYGLGQIKKELFSFNPEKPFRKDDCIDAIASCLIHEEVKSPYKEEQKPRNQQRLKSLYQSAWNV
ncbi:hypothetical protein OQH60_06585 [Campylobacter sp. MIT 21-1685]|nr:MULTISPECIES: hypothetical protein [unclassified Campylobacter]MCX2683531.1 hypothetical protein [Campylobacter sp. MIT 21-1684]MCX2751808.1 hypothetical protein [Campylobacter sp. MIT 21-1682]MCX2808015.1 hypothetical protein [Campylobacter sp. MIT 21-1685]